MGFFSKLRNLFSEKEENVHTIIIDTSIVDTKNNEIHNLKLEVLRLKLILVLERAESKKAKEQLIDIRSATTEIANKIYHSASCIGSLPISTVNKYKKEIVNNETNKPVPFYLVTYQNSPLGMVFGDSAMLQSIRQNAFKLFELSRDLS